MQGRLATYKRIVVKIGSALLVDRGTGLKSDWLKSLAHDIAELRTANHEVLVVSSGAIAMGRTVLDLPSGSLKLEESQAAAAVGQIALARAWDEALGAHGITTGQVLVTIDDTESRRRYLNARATIGALLRMKAVPVINENDTVATTEIRYGDNDRLAARVATMMNADLLVILSDVDGLYTASPALATDLARTLRFEHQRLSSAARHPVLADPRGAARLATEQLETARDDLHQSALDAVAEARRRLTRARDRLAALDPQTSLERAAERQADRRRDLHRAIRHALQRRTERIQAIHATLEAIGPTAVLQRGYSYTLGPDGRLVRSSERLSPGDRLRTQFADGAVDSEVVGDAGPQPRPARRPKRKPAPPDPDEPDQLDLFAAGE